MIKKELDKLSIFETIEFFRGIDIKSNEYLELICNKESYNRLGIKTFVELAQIFLYKIVGCSYEDNNYLITFKKLDTEVSFHKQNSDSEKYGIESEFFNINKIDEISFLYYYLESLKFIDIGSKNTILNIGVNKADEFLAIKNYLSLEEFYKKNFLGIDYSVSATEYAKEQFVEHENVKFLCADINKLDEVGLGRFDLLISIGTLQSSNINFNAKFMELYQNHLEKDGAVILGFPNCRWVDGEMIYGAKAPNYSFNEMSLVLKDIHFCKKYLQQKGYRVVITGKDYLFLSARKISKN